MQYIKITKQAILEMVRKKNMQLQIKETDCICSQSGKAYEAKAIQETTSTICLSTSRKIEFWYALLTFFF